MQLDSEIIRERKYEISIGKLKRELEVCFVKKLKFNKKIKSLFFVAMCFFLLQFLFNFLFNKPIFNSFISLSGLILGFHIVSWIMEEKE
jgi:hypothetical protein